jgi:hypothetical protein
MYEYMIAHAHASTCILYIRYTYICVFNIYICMYVCMRNDYNPFEFSILRGEKSDYIGT